MKKFKIIILGLSLLASSLEAQNCFGDQPGGTPPALQGATLNPPNNVLVDSTLAMWLPATQLFGPVLADFSGNGCNATFNGSGRYYSNSNGTFPFFPYNSGVYATVNTVPIFPEFSVNVWTQVVIPDGVSSIPLGNARLLEHGAYNNGWYLGLNFANLSYQFIVNNGNSTLDYGSCEGGTVDNAPHMITGTFDGTSAFLYVDGVKVAGPCQFSLSGVATYPSAQSSREIYIGTYSHNPSIAHGLGGWYPGTEYGIRYYSRKISDSEVYALFVNMAK